MSAGVHHTRIPALIFGTGFFEDGQRIEVCADANAPAAASIAKGRDDAGLRESTRDLVPHGGKLGRHIIGGLELGEADFGVLVQMASRCHDLGHVIRKAYRHLFTGC